MSLRSFCSSLRPLRAGFDVGPTLFAYNYTNDHLVCFSASTPSLLLCDIALTGLAASEYLVGIDFRPATGQLFAVGTSPAGDRVLTIDTDTGAVTPITAGFLTAIPGGYFGVDFTPVADRIRVVSNVESNVRLNPNTGALSGTDTSLAYAVGDPHEGATPDVVHLAYSNDYAGATSTTVFAIDAALDVLVRIGSVDSMPESPNTGLLHTIGPLGVDATSSGGFDIDGLAVPQPGAAGAAGAAVLALLGLRRARA